MAIHVIQVLWRGSCWMFFSSLEQQQRRLPQQLQKQASSHKELVLMQRQLRQPVRTKVKLLSRGTAQTVFTPWFGVAAQSVMVWCDLVLYNAIQHAVVLYNAIQNGVVLYNAIQHGVVVLCCAVQCNTTWYSMAWH